LYLHWEIQENGIVVESGDIKDLSVEGLAKKPVTIPYKWRPADLETFLNISYRYKAKQGFWAKDFEVAYEQLLLHEAVVSRPVLPVKSGKFSVQENEQIIEVNTSGSSILFDKSTGLMTSWQHNGNTIVTSGPEPNFWRPPTDNDYGARLQQKLKVWRTVWEERSNTKVELDHSAGNMVARVSVSADLLGGDAHWKTVYTIYPDGVIYMKNKMTAMSGNHPMLMKFGVRMNLPEKMEAMEWYGRGPHESYEDRKTSARVGIYNGSVSDQFHPYVRPQETGNKTDVRWLKLSANEGGGLFGI
jgi:beta-galactosidase